MKFWKWCLVAGILLSSTETGKAGTVRPNGAWPYIQETVKDTTLHRERENSHRRRPHQKQHRGSNPALFTDPLYPDTLFLPANPLAKDTLPIDPSVTRSNDSTALDTTDSTARKRSVFRKLYDYFNRSNIDRTAQKKIDFSLVLGPNYSSTTKLGLGILAAGLYRIDRSDLVTPPSDVSLYGNISTSGFMMIGVSGNNLFPRDMHRVSYDVFFYSMPSLFWGIGYENGVNSKGESSYLQHLFRVDASYMYRVWNKFYLGTAIDFHLSRNRRFTHPAYLEGQKPNYTNTGVGLILQYDGRDFIPNPYKGIYFRLEGTYYPKFLGTSNGFVRTQLTFDYYQKLWKGAILAFDLYNESNMGPEVPWTMLALMGGNRRMRGYYEGRFRDNNLIEVQLELRQRIWRRHGIVVWGGAGNVFEQWNSFQLSHTLPNYGVGYRFEFKNRVNIRLDFGMGRKGINGIIFNINEAF